MSARLLLAAAVLGAGCANFDEAERAWCERHPAQCDGGAPGGGGGALGGGGGETGGGGGPTGGGVATGGGGSATGGGGSATGGGGSATGGGGAMDAGGMGGGTGRDAGWSQEPEVTIFQLRGVWGSGPDQRWVVGYGGTILRGGGGAWTPESSGGPSDSYRGLWGRAEGDGGVRLWAVGFSGGAGVIRHRSGGTWNVQASPGGGYFNAVWGTDAGLWVVGENGIICQSNDGMTWSRVDSGVNTHLRAVWGSAANDVWAAGETTLHWDGTSWTELDAGPGLSFYALWGNGPGALWGAANGSLYRLDGGWLLTDQLFHSPLALWGSAENDLWITGNAGELSHWNGVSHSTSLWTLADGGQPALHGIWGSAPDDLWVVGTSGTILRGP